MKRGGLEKLRTGKVVDGYGRRDNPDDPGDRKAG